jgi:hypothetical protein
MRLDDVHSAAIPTDVGSEQEAIMVRRGILGMAFALALTLGALAAALAQSASSQPPAIEEWAHDFTVLTMAPDGSWGTATDPRINRAIFLAISNCKAMSEAELGCGAYLTTVRGGWSLGIRCGGENIIVADRHLAEAEQRAHWREADLRERYVRDMPPCVRVVTVDPNGAVVGPSAGQPPAGHAGRPRSIR